MFFDVHVLFTLTTALLLVVRSVIDYDDVLHLNFEEEDNSENAPERIPIPTYQGRVRGINGPRDNGSYNGCVLLAALVVLKHLISSSLIQIGDFVYIIDTHCAQLLEGLRKAQGVTPGIGYLIQSETNDEILQDVRYIAGTSGVGGNVFDPVELTRLLRLLEQTHSMDNRAVRLSFSQDGMLSASSSTEKRANAGIRTRSLIR